MKIKYYGTAAAEGIPGLFCSCEICENARKKRRDFRVFFANICAFWRGVQRGVENLQKMAKCCGNLRDILKEIKKQLQISKSSLPLLRQMRYN